MLFLYLLNFHFNHQIKAPLDYLILKLKYLFIKNYHFLENNFIISYFIYIIKIFKDISILNF